MASPRVGSEVYPPACLSDRFYIAKRPHAGDRAAVGNDAPTASSEASSALS
jgi:hypothetical protein